MKTENLTKEFKNSFSGLWNVIKTNWSLLLLALFLVMGMLKVTKLVKIPLMILFAPVILIAVMILAITIYKAGKSKDSINTKTVITGDRDKLPSLPTEEAQATAAINEIINAAPLTSDQPAEVVDLTGELGEVSNSNRSYDPLSNDVQLAGSAIADML